MRSYCLKVWGDYACFTRPEMKVERVSYDVITPSAARAIFDTILWKPPIRWRVTKIEVLNPIRWISVRRNEVGAVASTRNHFGLFIEDERQQRAGLFLRDVAYRIHAYFELAQNVGDNNPPGKFLDMFERRAANGQCFNQPYFGCREFAAHFALLDERAPQPEPIAESRDLGWTFYDHDYEGDEPTPRFFRAKLERGVMTVPPWESEEVKG